MELFLHDAFFISCGDVRDMNYLEEYSDNIYQLRFASCVVIYTVHDACVHSPLISLSPNRWLLDK